MIKPTKHTNLKYSVFNIAWNIISILKNNWVVSYSELLGILSVDMWNKVKESAMYWLSFLYLLWKIEYIKDLDSFKLK